MEDRLSELGLEEQDLTADRRLRNVQFLAGGGKGTRIGDGADDFELPEVHGSGYISWPHGCKTTNK